MPLDMTAMYATHDVLRRELEDIARVTVRIDDDPRRVLRTAAGWRMFKRTVRGHHRAEDEVLWPALRRQLTDRPSELVLLEAMEAEHAAIDQLIATIDELLAGPEACLVQLGALADSLVTGLRGHLAHEEQAVIPLIRRSLPTSQWAAFEQVHSERSGVPPSGHGRWSPDPCGSPDKTRHGSRDRLTDPSTSTSAMGVPISGDARTNPWRA
ncbi:hypothetical protein GCM10009827_116370 [Dactylosporangium maewongense]|uniref:Hemerythrin-like domain-containing protein n=1 Tax=Dactylosporangium maewongense TaxID=634393 RepID=A0ABN2DD41_9ACTN